MGLFLFLWLICVGISFMLVIVTDKDIWFSVIPISGVICLFGSFVSFLNPSSVLEKRHNVEFVDGVAGIVNLSKDLVKIQTKISKSLKPGDIILEKCNVYFDGSHGDSTYSLIETEENNGEKYAK